MDQDIRNILIGIRRWVNSKVTTLNTAIDGKAASVHTHTIGDVTNLQPSLDEKMDKTPPIPLRFTALEDNCTLGITNYGQTPNIEISTNDGNTWTTWDYTTINLDTNDSVLMRGMNTNGFSDLTIGKYSKFTTSGDISVSGNIMSLIDSTKEVFEIPNEYCFYSLFFQTTITTAPELPATILKPNCYKSMFGDCTSLVKAPELPAKILLEYSYSNMFSGCTSLNYVKCDATDISASHCTDSWLGNVATNGYFVSNPDTIWLYGQTGIPTGWLNYEPAYKEDEYLTFQVYSNNSTIYWKKLSGIIDRTIEYSLNGGTWTSLVATVSGATINVNSGDIIRFRGSNTSYATDRIIYCGFDGSTGSLYIYGNIMSLIYGDDFYGKGTLPNNWAFTSLFKNVDVISAEHLVLPARTLTESCYRAMFSNATGLTKAPKLPATTLAKECYWYMFENTLITEAPELPAKTLVNGCYGNMFNTCPNLNYIKCDAVYGIGASNALTDWVSGVAASGTFIKDPSTAWRQGNAGIPSGWTNIIDTSYTDDSIKNALTGKSNVGHTHTVSNITDLAATLANLLPIGSITLWSASTAPNSNWKICDGSAISRTDYADLFTLISTTYGTGDGSTTFNIPNLTGNFALGVSSSHVIGSTGGAETHTLDITEIPSHSHDISEVYNGGIVGTGNDYLDISTCGTSPSSVTSHSLSKASPVTYTGGVFNTTTQTYDTEPHNNMPPYLSLNYIIKVL